MIYLGPTMTIARRRHGSFLNPAEAKTASHSSHSGGQYAPLPGSQNYGRVFGAKKRAIRHEMVDKSLKPFESQNLVVVRLEGLALLKFQELNSRSCSVSDTDQNG